MAYLREVSAQAGTSQEVRAKRFDAKGKAQGAEFQPFGSGTHVALGRPAVAADGGSGLVVAVPASSKGASGDTVLFQRLDAKGSPAGSVISLFTDQSWTYLDGQGIGSLHVTYNSIANEFLVTVQRTIPGRYGPENGIWAQRVSASGGVPAAPVMLLQTSNHGIDSHTVSHAPVASPAGGRYLFAYAGFANGVQLLDRYAKSIAAVSADLGAPSGGHTHPDAAYGRIEGKDRFLLVFSDENNCTPGKTSCTATADQWTGVWGLFVDPLKPDAAATPFPISKIWSHVSARNVFTPRVAYDGVRKAFAVAWREIPLSDPTNTESRSHIRFNLLDSFVADGLGGTSQVPDPPDNTVVSTVTGSCATPKAPCKSLEDPEFPDVAATAAGAAVVWHQRSPPNVQIRAVVGRLLGSP